MNAQEVRNELFDILHRVAPEVQLDGINPGENLREALDIDSFDFLKVIIAIHDKFGIDIPESDYGKVSTLNGILEYVTHDS